MSYSNDLKNLAGVYKDCYEWSGSGYSGSGRPLVTACDKCM